MIEREFSGKDLDSLDEEQLRKVNIGYVTNPTATCLHALFSNVLIFLLLDGQKQCCPGSNF